MDFKVLASEQVTATTDKFWHSIKIWLNRPHLINKRILSSSIVLAAEIHNVPIKKLVSHIENIKNVSQFINDDGDDNFQDIFKDFHPKFLPKNTDFLSNENQAPEQTIYLIITKLFPKCCDNFSTTMDFVVIDVAPKTIIRLSKNINEDQKITLGVKWPYKVCFNNENLDISVSTSENNFDHISNNWLKRKLFSSLKKWMTSDPQQNKSLVEASLNLICSEKYSNLYNKLKKKYGDDLIRNWSECTDPKKFVFEELAIATYLLILWEQERIDNGLKDNQSFVDLGCGNGLLSYILTNEGHCGLGIDLRRRKIWDFFAQTTRLEEKTIIPSSKSLFPDADWIIGNHSDELTPWIPVIAARSSYKSRFFLLPCCAYEFDGRKYQRKSAANSQYFEYLNYIKSVCEGCGFETKLDKLRIPSTKRICLVGGLNRTYSEDKTEFIDQEIDKIITARAQDSIQPTNNNLIIEDKWSKNFEPRATVEKVRNCTKINKNIVNEIVELVSQVLLRKVRLIKIDNSGVMWNAGGTIKLCEIAQLVSADSLKELKKECGGLQTLLKNHSNIFKVVNGTVQLRIPEGLDDKVNEKRRNKSNIQFQVKPCWFFINHPNGCPLISEKCYFKH